MDHYRSKQKSCSRTLEQVRQPNKALMRSCIHQALIVSAMQVFLNPMNCQGSRALLLQRCMLLADLACYVGAFSAEPNSMNATCMQGTSRAGCDTLLISLLESTAHALASRPDTATQLNFQFILITCGRSAAAKKCLLTAGMR